MIKIIELLECSSELVHKLGRAVVAHTSKYGDVAFLGDVNN